MEGDNVLDVPILNPSNYIFESHRLYSFLSANWRNAFVSAFDLAKYGFYFTGDGDSCRCMFCKLEVRGWEPGDTANGEHRRWNPHCPFLQKGNLTGNVPIGLELTFSSHDSLSNPFVPTPIAKYGPHLKLCKNTKQNVLIEALGITPIGDMKYRQYRTLQSRENSFKLWPKQISQTPDVLCTAGFFYTGSGDRVICFQCGGGLKDWHPEDTPWSEHAKWFSSCPYLNIKKGKQFIDHIIRTNKEQESLASDRTAMENVGIAANLARLFLLSGCTTCKVPSTREMDSAIKQLQYKYDFLLNVIRKLSQEQEVLNRELDEQRQSKRWVEATLGNGKRYRFSLEKKTWHEAKESCEKNGMRLASPKTQRDVTLLHQKLRELEPESGFWLSASDVGLTNTDFKWLDGEKLPLDSSLWEKERLDLDAPLNYGETAKSCVFIRKILDDKLYEEKCSDFTNFICE
ncbi:Hypothetical predicted protein [Cloeon dipterum]|uniref:C-type lectin domain-containing protein n=1 Tax=Cloeon dipterum TaxID=197152 RepID=A0A8S1E552_9INSE|nr:Hypothetical predicted protein [Cloeon dipterum]